MQFGIAHAGGKYPTIVPPASFLLRGLSDFKLLGTKGHVFKTYLTPTYNTVDYPQDTWTGTITDLKSLAQTSQMVSLFSDTQITTHVVTTYTFANGVNNPWINGVTPTMLSNERAEIQALAEYLLTTYAGTNKTFVLQNTEGDWALLNGTDPTVDIPQQRPAWFAAFLRARQAGIEAARKNIGQNGVKILHCVECNRVLDAHPGVKRMINSVLPFVKCDLVSYTAYEAADLGLGTDQTIANALINSRLTKVLRSLQDAAPWAQICIGEFGWPENELSVNLSVTSLINQTMTTATTAIPTMPYMIYWQIYDNETEVDGVTPRGFFIYKPDGSLSGAGNYFKTQFT